MRGAGGVAAVLLAAGRSTRFGDADKLWAPLGGRPLVDHAASALRAVDFAAKIAVVPSGRAAPAGFAAVVNPDPGAGQSRSLALGVRAARAAGAVAVLVMLADMPFVSVDHLRDLLAQHEGPASLAASTFDGSPMPPALFGIDWFDALERQQGDRGARALLRGARLVRADSSQLMDIDTPADLKAGAGVIG